MVKYQLYTDGSCDVRTGIGAWGFAIVDAATNECVRYEAKRVYDTTNNRMELMAVLEGLKQFKKDTAVEVVCDSAYVVNCFKDKWYVKWRANNWYASAGPVKNPDLWQELLSVAESFTAPLTWTHIRGHQGNHWNEVVDKMCTEARIAE